MIKINLLYLLILFFTLIGISNAQPANMFLEKYTILNNDTAVVELNGQYSEISFYITDTSAANSPDLKVYTNYKNKYQWLGSCWLEGAEKNAVDTQCVQNDVRYMNYEPIRDVKIKNESGFPVTVHFKARR